MSSILEEKVIEELGEEVVMNDVVEIKETEENEIENILPLLDEDIVRGISEMGFEKMSPIQEKAIPHLLKGKDIIGQAQTGTGKTAAFGIPTLQMIDPEIKKLQAIILCPTRELAIQASNELRKISKYMHGIKMLPIYGGQEIGKQIAGLRGAQIIVGTPGRVMDHMRRKTIKLGNVKMVVLDEADEMLNMGFREDMELILGEITEDHQTVLFSATMPKPILDITKKFQKNAEHIKVASKELTIPLVSQKYYKIKNQDKDVATVRILEYYQPKRSLIFCNTKKKVDELTQYLKLHNYMAEGLHGDMSQHQRDMAMNRFRGGVTTILIATDVAARGIDVDDVEGVINYDIPQDIEYYVHRIGRTGRAGRKGRSFTFVTGKEIYKIRDIEKICNTVIKEKKMPSSSKVVRVKAEKELERVLEFKDSDDFELMKSYVLNKMEEQDCDALDIAASFLKAFVGEQGNEIEADNFILKKGGRGNSSRFGDRDGRGRDGRGRDRGRGDSRGRDAGRGDSRGRDAGRSDSRGRDAGRSDSRRDSGRGDRDFKSRDGRFNDKAGRNKSDREKTTNDGSRGRANGYGHEVKKRTKKDSTKEA